MRPSVFNQLPTRWRQWPLSAADCARPPPARRPRTRWHRYRYSCWSCCCVVERGRRGPNQQPSDKADCLNIRAFDFTKSNKRTFSSDIFYRILKLFQNRNSSPIFSASVLFSPLPRQHSASHLTLFLSSRPRLSRALSFASWPAT
jgi:hypothetical protein